MTSERHRVRAASLAVLALATAFGVAARRARASPAEPDAPAAADEALSGESLDGGETQDTGASTLLAVPAAAPAVTLAGGVNGSLEASGEAWTTWRYGRSNGSVPIDEATTRVRVSGSGRTFDGLVVAFSVGLLAPTLHTGPYSTKASIAAVWARHDRVNVSPDIEWDSSVATGRPSTIALAVASMNELSHTSERRGGVTVEVTHVRIHGSLDMTLPCARSAATLRQSCRPESIRGEF